MKAVHYLGLSLAVHAVLAVLFLLLRAPQPARTEEMRVILEFTPLESSQLRATAERPAAGVQASGAAVPSFPPGEDIPAPVPGYPGRALAAGSSERTAAAEFRLPAPPAYEAEIAVPAPAAVLDRVRNRAAGSGRREAQSALPAGDTELVWSGSGRRLLKQGDLSFPDILLREGQELDVEARFNVSPEGRVTNIKITRSSGYILVDRAIERALSEYLFEGSATGEMETGLIRFRFRLERLD
jgi:TonB family protein